ncbi:DUF5052 family protein [Enterococcus saccharolyticus]|uniref:DUF5052 domain-containing protein n=1 Tax=Enterococcus saccharolyticus subsp. saccharolyticus ATCC 43076 TaxID=1139996 RepID=S0NI50_9ENTE|nr:DUF5052 family protein [Enterococcus saccharolyticus]EOT29734.1 hypothetical protein OMQ_01047 [Enterococcus saccharolyticus subsp. saccharolyticus ATCC 43076]EOT80894.1 hypothetical protein I572_01426 [Enterococcus saccharolyticus subsp. saccharolyticus ATCC 43076]OJG89646.1 hypothetical protein RV16_GL002188 [Enterococcus saccharolyticus]
MKKKTLIISMVLSMMFLAGCQDIKMWFKGFEESFKGLEMVIQTYDEQSQLIDKITGKSVLIERDTTFDTNAETADSSVIQITIGNKEMHHVGSSMIIAEKGLENVFDKYAETVDAQTIQRGVPVINSLVNDFKNSFSGKEKVVLIRSQNGTPLATYGGNNVSLYKTDVPKSTGLLIDGQYLFVYRCDYTIYDRALLE